jgi:hypothetical protein
MNHESKPFIYAEQGTAPDDLQQKMLQAFAFGSEKDIASVKKQYLETYPDQLEGVEALFSIRPLLKLSQEIKAFPRLRSGEGFPPELKKKLTEIAEYNYLLTHFVWKCDDPAFLELFWQAFEKATHDQKELEDIRGRRVGIITQVATMKLFQQLRLTPDLSHPADDGMNSIDAWVDTRNHTQAVQVKTGNEREDIPDVIETDHIPELTIQFGPKGRRDLYASKHYEEARDFRRKIDKFRAFNPKLRGYLVVLPYSMVNHDTGTPDTALVDEIEQKMIEKGIKLPPREIEQEDTHLPLAA